MFFPPFSGMSQPVEDERIPAGPGGLFHGVYPAQVTDIADPLGQGRVRIRLPWSPDTGDGEGWEAWARIATLFAGGGRGSWFIPDVDDEVLVAFATMGARDSAFLMAVASHVAPRFAEFSNQHFCQVDDRSFACRHAKRARLCGARLPGDAPAHVHCVPSRRRAIGAGEGAVRVARAVLHRRRQAADSWYATVLVRGGRMLLGTQAGSYTSMDTLKSACRVN